MTAPRSEQRHGRRPGAAHSDLAYDHRPSFPPGGWETASVVLRLRASLDDEQPLVRSLAAIDGVRRVTRADAADGRTVVSADVDEAAAATVVEWLRQGGVNDFALVRERPVLRARSRAGRFALWPDTLQLAKDSSRATTHFLSLMAVAGLLAAIGVIDRNAILIVGAMAASPDLLPVSALAVGVVSREWTLTRRALVTLVGGLALATAAAAALTVLLDLTGSLPHDFAIGRGGIGVLARIDVFTVLVALIAGVASMLTFETRASLAVGVAISVTTIPASAYLGVAVGVGDGGDAARAAAVLGINVVSLVAAGAVTLLVQLRAADDIG